MAISPDGNKASSKTPWNFSSPIGILCLNRWQIGHSLERTKKVIHGLSISHYNNLVAVGFRGGYGSGLFDIWDTTSHKTAISIT